MATTFGWKIDFVTIYLRNHSDLERQTSDYVVSNYDLSFDTKTVESLVKSKKIGTWPFKLKSV